MKNVKYSRSRLSCNSFFMLGYIILTWFKRAKPQIYIFLMGENMILSSQNDEHYDEKSSTNEKSGKSPGSSQIISGMSLSLWGITNIDFDLTRNLKNDKNWENSNWSRKQRMGPMRKGNMRRIPIKIMIHLSLQILGLWDTWIKEEMIHQEKLKKTI